MEKENIKFALQPLKLNIAVLSFRNASFWRKAHFHEALELVHVSDGVMCVHINNESVALSGGDTMLINRNVMHCLENIQSTEATYIQLEMADYYDSLRETETLFKRLVNSRNANPYFVTSGKSELCDIFLAIQREMLEKKPYYQMYVKAYIGLIVPFMLRSNIIGFSNADANTKAQRLLPLAKYVENNYVNPITLEECAELVGYTKFELCRKFKAVVGMTLSEYINYVRLHRAKELLKAGGAIADIAFNCGFSSIQYFDKIFKKYNGCTPSEYKCYML